MKNISYAGNDTVILRIRQARHPIEKAEGTWVHEGDDLIFLTGIATTFHQHTRYPRLYPDEPLGENGEDLIFILRTYPLKPNRSLISDTLKKKIPRLS